MSDSPCWVAISPKSCGHCVAAMVCDEWEGFKNGPSPERMAETARELKRWQRSGLKIEKRDSEWVRQHLKGCELCCPKTYGKLAKRRQQELAL